MDTNLRLLTISRLILLWMKNISDKRCRAFQNTILCSIFFFENRAFHEIMWKSIVKPDRSLMTIQYVACALHVGRLKLQTDTQIT